VHLDGDGPTAIILTRQDVPVLEGTAERAPEGLPRGAYTLVDETAELSLVLIGTGSEVQLCVAAAEILAGEGIGVRAVSMPSWDLFEAQDDAYRDTVLPAGVPRLSVEAGVSFGWDRYADDSVSIDRFGASAPGSTVMTELGMTVDHVLERARQLLAREGRS
jgi:transketolase